MPPAQPTLVVEWGRTAKPGDALSSIAWTNISQYVEAVSLSRGRSNEFSSVEAGSGEVLLSNGDRRFDPLHSTGPYYPIKLRSRVRVRATWDNVSHVLAVHYLEAIDQDWSPPSKAYSRAVMRAVDGFGVLRQMSLDIGGEAKNTSATPDIERALGQTTNPVHKRAQYFAAMVQGQEKSLVGYGTSLSRVSCWLRKVGSPTDSVRMKVCPNAAGLPDEANALVTVDVPASQISDQGGVVEFALPSPVTLATNGKYWVVLSRTGAASDTNYYLVGADSTSTGVDPDYWTLGYSTGWSWRPPRLYLAFDLAAPEELSGTRISRILDAAGFPPSADRSIDTGQSVLAREALSGDALSLLTETARSERGIFFFDRFGKAVFHDRHRRLKSPYLTPVATFGDAAGELGYVGIGGDFDVSSVRNRVSLTPLNKRKQTAEDATSVSTYGARVIDEEVKLTSEAEALDQATYLVATYKEPLLRFDELRVRGDSDPSALWPKILPLELGDRVTVKRRPQNVGSAISVDQHVEGISHRISPGSWETTLRVSPASDPATNGFWILGDSVYGVLGSSTRLAY